MYAKFEDFYSKRQLIVKILWGAMVMSIAMLGVVLFVTNPDPVELSLAPFMDSSDPMMFVFIGAAVVCGILAVKVFDFLKARIDQEKFDRNEFLDRIEHMRAEGGQRIYTPEDITFLKTVNDDGLKILNRSMKMFTAYIARFALTEVIALMGFVSAHTKHNKALFIPFGVVAIIMMLAFFPKSELKSELR